MNKSVFTHSAEFLHLTVNRISVPADVPAQLDSMFLAVLQKQTVQKRLYL